MPWEKKRVQGGELWLSLQDSGLSLAAEVTLSTVFMVGRGNQIISSTLLFFFCYLGKIDTVRNFSRIFNQQYTGEKVLTFTHCSE